MSVLLVFQSTANAQQPTTTTSVCDPTTPGDYNLSLHIAGVFILLVVSSVGIYGTILLGSSSYKNHPGILLTLQILKFFGSGVIIATAWIHMVPSSFAQFTSPCLTGGWSSYGGNFTGLFAMIAAFIIQSIEFAAMSRRDWQMKKALEALKPADSSEGLHQQHHHHHTHNHVNSNNNHNHSNHSLSPHVPSMAWAQSPTSQLSSNPSPLHPDEHVHLEHVHGRNGDVTLADVTGHSHAAPQSFTDLSTFMLELGIVFHSVIIGLALGVATDEWSSLIIALAFHQLFEGMALGTRIAELNTSLFTKIFFYGLMYPLTTPLGTVIGIAVRSTYNSNSEGMILMQGILDGLSAGVLMYNSYVELISVEMNHNPSFRAQPPWRKVAAFVAMWFGAGLMALIGVWA
ncbi:hypothetical protein SmJEL517_g04027 [Synchytrium microbalum]|uniref:Zinc/iron permease n=1 Tax=Synchytrium microbalum TaxID=1806994 RepID=A0A507BVZ3_9FUNG|nr:uncharacterized protein SmJEL517_g04027 [Synchytrium microbalum]TPX33027.1 hypothetical protein SmJEL517_g04027 [Synchytrium microbalum]